MIVTDAKMRLGCADFAPDFTLYETRDQMANWDVQGARHVAGRGTVWRRGRELAQRTRRRPWR